MTRRALLPYFLLVFAAMMSMGGVFPLLGELRDELGFSETGLGVMVAFGFFSAFASQIGLARFADRGHTAAMIRLGLVAIAASMGLMAVADELWQFVILRMLLGLGVGALLPAVRRLVIVADPPNMGRNVGTLGAFDVGGFLVGPLVAGACAALAGFRAPFAVLAVATVMFVPLVARLPGDRGEVTSERRVVAALLRERGVQAMLVAAVGWFAMIGVFEAVWAVMLTDRGAETWLIAVTVSLIMVPMLVISPFSGHWAQRHGPLRVAVIGVLLVIPCFVMYGFVDSLVLLTVIALAQGVGDALVFPATQVGVAVAAPDELAASAQGLQGATLQLVAGLTALVAGAAYESAGAEAVFVAGGVLMALGVVGSVLLARPLGRTHPLVRRQEESHRVGAAG